MSAASSMSGSDKSRRLRRKMRAQYLVSALGLILSGYLAQGCLDLAGIVSGGGDGLLDLDLVSVTVEKEPFDFSIPAIPTVAVCSNGLETPISMRNLLGIDTAAFSVVEMFYSNPEALDIFGDKEKSDARRRCYPGPDATAEEVAEFDLHLRVAILYTVSYGGRLSMPYCEDEIDASMESLELPMSLILEDDPDIDTPWGLAKAYVDDTFSYMLENDGWNADGSMSRTHNLIPFSDYAYTDSDGNSWEPYVPMNPHWDFKVKDRWQPLTEHDDLGYIFSQLHVTPHIGAMARFYGFNSLEDEEEFFQREAPDPGYEYESASTQVLEEARLMATDEFKQTSIQFYDNKFSSLIPLKIAFFLRDPVNYPARDFYLVTLAVQLSIYNGVIMSWREKIRHDLPRPPSVITDLFGDTEVLSYAGEDGLAYIKASEWESFIRTMPHSEYPSASACLCQVFADQLVEYTGTNIIDPPLEFQIGDDVNAEYPSWSAIAEDCGNSRLWGGMHFYEAVPNGRDLCGGSGMAASVFATLTRLAEGDETAAVFKDNPGELKVRPY